MIREGKLCGAYLEDRGVREGEGEGEGEAGGLTEEEAWLEKGERERPLSSSLCEEEEITSHML